MKSTHLIQVRRAGLADNGRMPITLDRVPTPVVCITHNLHRDLMLGF